MDGDQFCCSCRSRVGFYHGRERQRRYGALAFVRKLKSTSGGVGFAGDYTLSEAQGRIEVYRYSGAVSDYAGDYKLGYGEK